MITGVSLGWNCEAAGRAVQMGIRKIKSDGYKTCPFDECLTKYEGIQLCLKEDFKHFCDPVYLELREAPYSTGGIVKGERLLYNTRYNFIFNHESPDHANLYLIQSWSGGKNHYINNNYELFIERYSRRITNFRKYVSEGNIHFVIVRFDSDTSELEKVLTENYPELTYTITSLSPHVSRELFDGHYQLMNA